MTLSRWKMLAGVLGVSLGGFAAVAAKCPKSDATKTGAPDSPALPVQKALPPTPPAANGPASPPPLLDFPSPALPAAPAVEAPVLPPAPALPPMPAKPADVKPPMPASPLGSPAAPIIPASGTAPKLPPAPTLPMSDSTKPSLPPDAPSLPSDFEKTPPKPPEASKPLLPPALEAPPKPEGVAPGKPLPPPSVGFTPPPPPGVNIGSPAMPPEIAPADPLIAPVEKPVTRMQQAVPVAASKFRILLRVGEGEPTFEVRTGDDLVLKVTCERVDIKSPEKGSGLSSVKASGKVRFAGFGAEGTCEELSFLAGTGEVSMTGEVKIQVKDKLGRIESELSSATTIKYKLDPGSAAVTNPISSRP